MRKILSIAVLSLFLTAQTSQAFAPVAIPVWYYGAGALAVGGGVGVYAAVKSGVASTVDVAGNLRRKAGVAWVALSSANVPTLFEKDVVAQKTYSQIVATVNAAPSLFAKLKAAASTLVYPGYTNAVAPASSSCTYAAGSTVHLGSARCVQVVRVEGSPAGWNGNVSGSLSGIRDWPPGSFFEVYHPTSEHPEYPNAVWIEKCYYSVETAPTPETLTATPAAFQAAVAPTGTVTDADYQAELERALKDSTYIPTFSDDTTGLPFAYPANPMSPAALAAYNAQGVAADEREQALTAAQQAATSAVAAKDAAVAASNADPTNTALAQKAADATAAASAATAAAQKVAAENATTAAQDAVNEAAKESAVGITIPAVKSFSWARFADLKGSLAATFPFYLIPKIGDLMGQIAPETPTPPVFTLPVYGKTYQISLEMFDPIASALRGFIAVIASIACIIMMVKFYRGTS